MGTWQAWHKRNIVQNSTCRFYAQKKTTRPIQPAMCSSTDVCTAPNIRTKITLLNNQYNSRNLFPVHWGRTDICVSPFTCTLRFQLGLQLFHLSSRLVAGEIMAHRSLQCYRLLSSCNELGPWSSCFTQGLLCPTKAWIILLGVARPHVSDSSSSSKILSIQFPFSVLESL